MPRWLIPMGRVFYAIGLAGIGVQHFIFADFITVILPSWPAWIPGRLLCAYATGAALIAAGAAILFSRWAGTVAAVTGTALLALVAFAQVPAQLAAHPGQLAAWTHAFKELTLCGGALVVAGSLPRSSAPRYLEFLMPAGRFFLPITVVAFGIDHFLYPVPIAKLVPSWIPGGLFWTYFAGVALISAGVGMSLRIQHRLASLLLGIMIFLWLIILHIPRAIADPHSGNGNEWSSVLEALAFSGIAFMLAAVPASISEP